MPFLFLEYRLHSVIRLSQKRYISRGNYVLEC